MTREFQNQKRPGLRLESDHLPELLKAIKSAGYTIVGPVVRDGAIVYDRLDSVSEMPVGWTDIQEAGSYRLERRQDKAIFGYAVGPHSWKRFISEPRYRLWRATRSADGFEVETEEDDAKSFALIGVRACEIHAMAIQDLVFLKGKYSDERYKARREKLLIVAVNCMEAGGTCFCASMGTGPAVSFGFDILLTEMIEGDSHYFLFETGSSTGEELAKDLPLNLADRETIMRTEARVAAERMGRRLDTAGIRDLFYENQENPQWDEVASRCLSCANCTMVCPTCFCTAVEDVTDLKGETAERWMRWDSCFTAEFSYIHGGSVRQSTASRYRQWISHKLATWIDQFGVSGCVGCGRCITWCPVGIDITDEARKLREHRTGGKS